MHQILIEFRSNISNPDGYNDQNIKLHTIFRMCKSATKSMKNCQNTIKMPQIEHVCPKKITKCPGMHHSTHMAIHNRYQTLYGSQLAPNRLCQFRERERQSSFRHDNHNIITFQSHDKILQPFLVILSNSLVPLIVNNVTFVVKRRVEIW